MDVDNDVDDVQRSLLNQPLQILHLCAGRDDEMTKQHVDGVFVPLVGGRIDALLHQGAS